MTTKNFSVKNGLTAGTITLDATTGNTTTGNLSVTGKSVLGPASNVTITGGSSGYLLSTDGTGNLSFISPGATAQSPAPMPIVIDAGNTLTISANYQGLFGYPLTVNGTLEVEGILIDVNDNGNGGGAATSVNASVANVIITGGTSGQYLQTDGTGNLSWAAGGGGGGGSPGGVTTQVQFNDAGSFAGNSGFTFNKTTTTVTANNFVATSTANLGAVGNVTITGGSSGYVLSTNGSGGLSWIAQSGGESYGNSNVVTLLTAYGSNTITTTGNVSVGNIIGNGQALSGITGANVTGAVGYASIANSVAAANVSGLGNVALINKDGNASNILYGNGVFSAAPSSTYNNSNVVTLLTSYGSNTITTTGNVSVGNIIGNGQALSGITGANVTGAVAYATTANSVALANVSGAGNIASVNLTGSSSNVLYGNGVFAAPAGGGGASNARVMGYSLVFGG